MKKLEKILSNRKMQIILIATFICIIGIIIILSIRASSATTEKTTTIENQIVDGLSFENAKIVTENGVSKYTAEIYNDLETTYSLKYIEVILKDSSSKEIATIYGYVGDTIEKNSIKYLDISTDQEITDISTVEYIIHQ